MDKKRKSIFEFHTGFEVQDVEHQSITTCPFCEKEDHFFFNNETYQWDCKVCHKNGNAITFVRQFYELFDNVTNTTKFISEERGIPVGAVSQFRLKMNTFNNSYLIPTYKHGKISNLYKAIKVTRIKDGERVTGWEILASPSLDHTLFNWDEFVQPELWIMEGHWDRMAAQAIIQSKNIDATAAPGSGVWKPAWCEALSEKDIVFCYDNDMSGRTGFEAVILKHIATSQYKPKSISYIHWPEDKKKGYDVNDCYREYGRGAYNVIKEWIKPYTAPQDTIVVKTSTNNIPADHSCTSFDELMVRFESAFHTTDSMRFGFLLVLSSIYSVKIEGEQLWIRLIGPPSAGKTTIAKCVSGSEQVVLKSTFTGLFSGWRDEKNPNKDASLVPLIAGKTLIVKDADALLKQKNIEEIFSQLRDFYDKDSDPYFKNMVAHSYHNIRSTMILCGTNILRRSDQSFLGERFMDFELILTDSDRDLIEERALQRSLEIAMNPSLPPPETPIIAAVKGFLESIWNKEVPVMLGPREQNLVRVYARLASMMRTKVDRDRTADKDVTFKPAVEVSARLVGQLTKLYTCATIIVGRDKPNEMVHELVRKVARDIIDMDSLRYKICFAIAENYLSREQIFTTLGGTVSRNKINIELLDLAELKMIDIIKTQSDSTVGAHVYKMKLKEHIANALSYVGI